MKLRAKIMQVDISHKLLMDKEYIKHIKSRARLMRLRCASGLKPVWRIEKRLEMPQIEGLLKDREIGRFKCHRIRKFEGKYELFLGNDCRQAEEAVKLTDVAESPHMRDAGETERAIGEMGVLLGYPRCCSRRFAKDRVAVGEMSDIFHGLLIVKRRIEFGNRAVSANMNPFSGELDFVPCRLDCGAALDTVEKKMDGFGIGGLVGRAVSPWMAKDRLKRIFFFLLSGAECVSIVPAALTAGERAGYARPKAVRSGNRLTPFFDGDSFRIGPGQTKIFKRGKEIARFGPELAAWHHRECFYPEFWKDYIKKLLGENAKVF